MKIEYATHYSSDYWTGRKTYRNAVGEEHRYHGPSLTWEGFEYIANAFQKVIPIYSLGEDRTAPASLLDIGCGAGDLAARLRHRGFDSYGVDVSQYAIANAVPAMRNRVVVADITTSPLLAQFPATFDVVMATDLLEHIYAEDLETTFDWILSKTRKWMFFCVATVEDVNAIFVHKKGTPVPPEHQGTAVSGHVNVQTFNYWARFFKRRGLVIDWQRMYHFQLIREMSRPWRDTAGWNMQTTFVLRRPDIGERG